jgi:hypothetical protein
LRARLSEPSSWSAARIFEGISLYESGCDRGTHVRAFVGDPQGQPAGVAWSPRGLDAIPSIVGAKTVELTGPDGSSLLFVHLSDLESALRHGATAAGIGEDDERLRVLASLGPTSEPAVHGLFALIRALAVP